MTLAGVLRDLERFDEAGPLMEEAAKLTGRNTLVLMNFCALCSRRGDVVRANALADELVERGGREWVSPYYLALALAAVNRREEAFTFIERAVDSGDFWAAMMGVDPLADILRDDARLDSAISRMRISGYLPLHPNITQRLKRQ